MMAAVAIGAYGTMDDCIAEWVTPLLGAPEAPDADLSAIYDRNYPAYVATRQAMVPVWDTLAGDPRAPWVQATDPHDEHTDMTLDATLASQRS